MKKILVVGCFLVSAAAFAQNQQNNAQNEKATNQQNNKPVAVAPAPAPAPVAVAPAPQPVAAQAEPTAAPAPVVAPVAPAWQIVGVGTNSLCPKHLLVRGCEVAVFESNVCAVSQKDSNGSDCFAVWSHNGKLHSRWISARDFNAMQDFIARTKATCQLQFTPKHPGRECYDDIPGAF